MEQAKEGAANAIFKVGKKRASQDHSHRVAWSKQHDTQLLALVKNYKGKNWKKIAQEMQDSFNDQELSAKKCRERWCNCTNPDIDKTSLTEREELLLLIYHHEYKNKWVVISHYLPHRNSSKLKNNFSSLIRKVARKIGLSEKENALNVYEYVQIMYASVLIHNLALIKDSPQDAIVLAPIHIYDHIKKKEITGDQCLSYFKKVTTEFINRYKAKKVLQRLNMLNQIDTVKAFLDKLITEIRKSCMSLDMLTEDYLLILLENLLVSCEVPSAININPQPLPAITPVKDFIKRQQLNQFECEIPSIPELQAWNFSMIPPNYSSSPLLTFPSFASTAFQQSLLSPQSQIFSSSTNNPFSPCYYLSMPTAGTPQVIGTIDKSFMMRQNVAGVLENGGRTYRASDFSAITDKFMQH